MAISLGEMPEFSGKARAARATLRDGRSDLLGGIAFPCGPGRQVRDGRHPQPIYSGKRAAVDLVEMVPIFSVRVEIAEFPLHRLGRFHRAPVDAGEQVGLHCRNSCGRQKLQFIEGEPKGCAHIIDGARACPPEDVGGPFGYQQFLDTLAEDPDSEEANDYRRWAGNDFNAELFDRRAANAALLRMAWNRWGGK